MHDDDDDDEDEVDEYGCKIRTIEIIEDETLSSLLTSSDEYPIPPDDGSPNRLPTASSLLGGSSASKNAATPTAGVGSRPKTTNVSRLYSSEVAYATLERCLLGWNPGTPNSTSHNKKKMSDGKNINENNSIDNNESDIGDTAEDTDDEELFDGWKTSHYVNYSTLCKPGHVIDILELRRLSSRGVPDQPVSSGSTTTLQNPTDDDNCDDDSPITTTTDNTTQQQQQRRSYRPLVWRVLLGYLPPQTDTWNNILQRQRNLYNALVYEFFTGTCPCPHDLLVDDGAGGGEEEKLKPLTMYKRNDSGKPFIASSSSSMLLDDESNEELVNDTSVNKNNNNNDDEDGSPPSPPPASPRLTPGLLSARMQQEWVRGENEWENGATDPAIPSLFDAQNENSNNNNNRRGSSRLSPMCAMNIPRMSQNNSGTPGQYRKGERDGKVDQQKQQLQQQQSTPTTAVTDDDNMIAIICGVSPLIPNDDTDSDDETKDVTWGETKTANTTATTISNATSNVDLLPPPPSAATIATCHRSISIGTNENVDYEEGVECCDDNVAPKKNSSSDHLPSRQCTISPTTDEEENALLLDEIRKDVIRTHPDLRFFLEPYEDLGQKRYAALERILYVWAKLNKGVRYVQGMNEIVGTLYYVLAHDSNTEWSNEAEADTYFLFNSLLVEMRDVFVPDLDEADTGIHGRISNMITLLSLHDPEVRCHLDSVGIDPSFYSVRWLTTLLSREFVLPDTIRLWDSMFASTHKDNFLRYVSVTMVMVIRDTLLLGDFSTCLRLLQAYPPTNLDRLLESSRALWIYESQITLACHKGGISLGHALRSIAPPPAIVMAYGLRGGVAPPIREQVRRVGERGLEVARGAANGTANASKSFFGNAISYWKGGMMGGNSTSSTTAGEVDGSLSTKEVRR